MRDCAKIVEMMKGDVMWYTVNRWWKMKNRTNIARSTLLFNTFLKFSTPPGALTVRNNGLTIPIASTEDYDHG